MNAAKSIVNLVIYFAVITLSEAQQYQPQGQGQHQQVQYQQQNQYQQQGQYQQQQVHGQHQQVQGQHHQQVAIDRNLIRDKSHVQDKEHIKEHLEGVIDEKLDTSKMTEEELQFHYFKMHDSDNNNMLDGSELCKSIIHWHVEEGLHKQDVEAKIKVFTDNELISMIDPILRDDDRNNNGYIEYEEFIFAQQSRGATPPA